jgi:hypothetical protein
MNAKSQHKPKSLLEAAEAWVKYLDGPGDGADDSQLEQRLMQDLRQAVAEERNKEAR